MKGLTARERAFSEFFNRICRFALCWSSNRSSRCTEWLIERLYLIDYCKLNHTDTELKQVPTLRTIFSSTGSRFTWSKTNRSNKFVKAKIWNRCFEECMFRIHPRFFTEFCFLSPHSLRESPVALASRANNDESGPNNK